MNQSSGLDIYGQIVNAWRFLHVGLTVDTLMREAGFPQIPNFHSFGHHFESKATKAFWPKEFTGQSKESYFGSTVFYYSAREIFSGISEGITLRKKEVKLKDETLSFHDFVENKLGPQFSAFDPIIKFCRNVLSHNVTGPLILEKLDFEDQKKFVIKYIKMPIKLTINYNNVFDGIYSQYDNFKITLDFTKITEGKSLFDFISQEQLMQLVILSGCLAEDFINSRSSIALDKTINGK